MTGSDLSLGSSVDIGSVNHIPIGEGREFYVNGELLAVFRLRNGNIRAIQATCSHKDGRLADGLTGDDKVICPMHSYKFNLCTGKPLDNTCEALKTYDTSVSKCGNIMVTI